MSITVKQLQHIISVIENDGYRNAAKSEFITQAGISNSIRTLENHLGQKIFKPSYKIALTPYGEIALPWIKEFVEHYGRLSSFLTELADGNAGILRVSCLPTILNDCVPTILNSFKDKYKNVNVILSDHPINRIHSRLLSNETDVAISTPPHDLSDKIEFIELYNEPLGFLLPKSHPLAKKQSLSVDDVKEYNFISNGMTLNINHDPEIKKLNNRAIQYVDNILSLITMVEMNVGISIMAKGLMPSLGNNIKWVPISANTNSRKIGIMFHKTKTEHPTLQLFIDICKKELYTDKQ
ncbi:MAG: LysR family transcriptional regulator [Alphaproteobacteria bacterium]